MMFQFDAHKDDHVFDNHNDKQYQDSQDYYDNNALLMALLDTAAGWQN